VLPGERPIQLFEGLEQFVPLLFLDSDTLILDDDTNKTLERKRSIGQCPYEFVLEHLFESLGRDKPHKNTDLPAILGELHRV
jgi:hypothetical protein